MNNLKHIKSLDGLRAIAVIGVLASHFIIYRSGWLGVQLFFVLSGYLIINILLNEKETSHSITYSIKRFYYRRSLRIFPLYYFYLFLMACLSFPDGLLSKMPYLTTYSYNLTRFSHSFTYSGLVNHLWSLCVEEQFYLIFPFIIFFFSKDILKKIFIFLFLFSPVFRIFLYLVCKKLNFNYFSTGDIIYIFTPSHFDAFVTGGGRLLYSDYIKS